MGEDRIVSARGGGKQEGGRGGQGRVEVVVHKGNLAQPVNSGDKRLEKYERTSVQKAKSAFFTLNLCMIIEI